MRIRFAVLMLATLLLTTCSRQSSDAPYIAVLGKNNRMLASMQTNLTESVSYYLNQNDARKYRPDHAESLLFKNKLLNFLIDATCAEFQSRDKNIPVSEVNSIKKSLIEEFTERSWIEFDDNFYSDSLNKLKNIAPAIAENQVRLLGYKLLEYISQYAITSCYNVEKNSTVYNMDSLHYIIYLDDWGILGMNTKLQLLEITQDHKIIPLRYCKLQQEKRSAALLISLEKDSELHIGDLKVKFKTEWHEMGERENYTATNTYSFNIPK